MDNVHELIGVARYELFLFTVNSAMRGVPEVREILSKFNSEEHLCFFYICSDEDLHVVVARRGDPRIGVGRVLDGEALMSVIIYHTIINDLFPYILLNLDKVTKGAPPTKDQVGTLLYLYKMGMAYAKVIDRTIAFGETRKAMSPFDGAIRDTPLFTEEPLYVMKVVEQSILWRNLSTLFASYKGDSLNDGQLNIKKFLIENGVRV